MLGAFMLVDPHSGKLWPAVDGELVEPHGNDHGESPSRRWTLEGSRFALAER